MTGVFSVTVLLHFCSGFVYYNLVVFGPKHEFVCVVVCVVLHVFFLAHMCTSQPYILVLCFK